jgi:glycosyltransferase involved in cell wall biosynthesis
MRIGIVTRRVGFNDGQGRVNLEIAAEALRQGHAVRLYSEHVDPQMVRAGAVPDLVVPPALLPTRLLRDQLFAWRTRGRLAGGAERCDAVLACGFATWAPADVNAVHFVHRSWLRSPYHPWRLRRTPRSLYTRVFSELNRHLERDAFRRSGTIVAVSDKVRRELIEAGVPPARIVTIVNGVDAEEFHPGPARRGLFGLPEGVQLALFAGDLKTPRKNLDTVLRALVEVPGLHLAVAGRHLGTPWPAMARDLGVAERVHFLGFQTDMPELMRAVDLFAFPSRYEACSLVLLEALASGLPVVTAESAGGAELITPDVGVVLADSDDVAALAAALRGLLAAPERRRAMAAAARQLALAHSWPAMARRYLELLQRAATRRAGVPAAILDPAHA